MFLFWFRSIDQSIIQRAFRCINALYKLLHHCACEWRITNISLLYIAARVWPKRVWCYAFDTTEIYSLRFILYLSYYRAHSLGCRLCGSHAHWLALWSLLLRCVESTGLQSGRFLVLLHRRCLMSDIKTKQWNVDTYSIVQDLLYSVSVTLRLERGGCLRPTWKADSDLINR